MTTQRKDIQFNSDGTVCSAWFYTGYESGDKPRPCVVMAHGMGGTRDLRLDAYAEKFAAAGYHVVVFDYRYFGASEGTPRQLVSVKKQIEDWRSAIFHARKLPQVDAAKVVLWGSSFSGGHVIQLAAEDSRIAAVISQVPHWDGIATLLSMSPTAIARLTAHGLVDAARSVLGLAPHYVAAIGEPGELGLMTAAGEKAGYLNLVPESVEFDQRIAARIALTVPLYSPGHKLRRLKIPVLVQVATNDVTTPPKPVIKACEHASNVTLKKYPVGHFDPYVEPAFSAIIKDQLSFLSQQFK